MLKTLYFSIALSLPLGLLAQTSLYSENFESGGSSIAINTSDLSGVAVGDNPWVINNIYAGGSGNFTCPTFPISVPFTVPAAPQQPAGITNNPTSSHLHITPQIALAAGGTLPAASYVAADGLCLFGGMTNFAKMTSNINTMGYDSVVFDHWWACGGSSAYYGELYYSINGGSTWILINNPNTGTGQWYDQTTWKNEKLSLAAWANQATLRFGFRFVSGSTATGSELDPGYAIDDIEIIGYTNNGCTNTSSSFSASNCHSYTSPSGLTWTSSGTYMDTIPNAAGCDSVITINLAILNSSSSTITPTACDSYTSPSGNYNWTASGTYMDTISNLVNCDSIITINLTIQNADTSVSLNGITLTSNAFGTNVSYQWVDCINGNAPISGETNQSFTPTTSGSYAVLLNDNGCGGMSSCYNIVVSSISNIKNTSNWSLYPNPTNGELNLDFKNIVNNPTVEIFNTLGQSVSRQTYPSSSKINLNLEGTAGIYWVRVSNEEQVFAGFKVVKE